MRSPVPLVLNRLFAIVVLFAAATEMCAQAPGYMGKRWVAGYGFYTSPAFSAYMSGIEESVFNTQHEVFIEVATKNRWSFGGSLKFYRTTHFNNRPVFTADFSSVVPEGSFDIRARNYDFYFKHFKRVYLAPWGRYMIFGLSIMNYNTSYSASKMRYEVFDGNNNRKFLSNFGPPEQSFNNIDLLWGNGNTRVIKDVFTLEFGYTVHVVALTTLLLDAFDYELNSPGEYIENNAAYRVRGMNRFNIFIKAGFLF